MGTKAEESLRPLHTMYGTQSKPKLSSSTSSYLKSTARKFWPSGPSDQATPKADPQSGKLQQEVNPFDAVLSSASASIIPPSTGSSTTTTMNGGGGGHATSSSSAAADADLSSPTTLISEAFTDFVAPQSPVSPAATPGPRTTSNVHHKLLNGGGGGGSSSGSTTLGGGALPSLTLPNKANKALGSAATVSATSASAVTNGLLARSTTRNDGVLPSGATTPTASASQSRLAHQPSLVLSPETDLSPSIAVAGGAPVSSPLTASRSSAAIASSNAAPTPSSTGDAPMSGLKASRPGMKRNQTAVPSTSSSASASTSGQHAHKDSQHAPHHPLHIKGQLHVKLIQARDLARVTSHRSRPYVVVQFEQSEFVSREPIASEREKEIKGKAGPLSRNNSALNLGRLHLGSLGAGAGAAAGAGGAGGGQGIESILPPVGQTTPGATTGGTSGIAQSLQAQLAATAHAKARQAQVAERDKDTSNPNDDDSSTSSSSNGSSLNDSVAASSTTSISTTPGTTKATTDASGSSLTVPGGGGGGGGPGPGVGSSSSTASTSLLGGMSPHNPVWKHEVSL